MIRASGPEGETGELSVRIVLFIETLTCVILHVVLHIMTSW